MSKKKEIEPDIPAAKAEVHVAVPKFDLFVKQVKVISDYLKTLRFKVVDLENRKSSLEAECKRLTEKAGRIEQEVKDRIAGMDKSVRKLFEEANQAKHAAREAENKAKALLEDAERKNNQSQNLLSGAKIQRAAMDEIAERTGVVKAAKE